MSDTPKNYSTRAKKAFKVEYVYGDYRGRYAFVAATREGIQVILYAAYELAMNNLKYIEAMFHDDTPILQIYDLETGARLYHNILSKGKDHGKREEASQQTEGGDQQGEQKPAEDSEVAGGEGL